MGMPGRWGEGDDGEGFAVKNEEVAVAGKEEEEEEDKDDNEDKEDKEEEPGKASDC